MTRLTPADYRTDKLYPRVAHAIADLLKDNLPVSAPAVFVRMGMLSEEHLRAWRSGKVPYLERVINGSLGKTNRVVRIISLYAHDLKLPPAPPHAAGPIKYKGRPLRFCKTGERPVEDAYKRVFRPRPAHWKEIPPPDLVQRQGGGRAVEHADGADEPQL